MTDPHAAEVRRLRSEEQLSVREIRARTGLGRNRVYELLRGVPPPERTRRPNAKDDLRAEAVALRSTGHSVPEIARRLRVSKSTAHLWVRHVPLDREAEEEVERRRAHSKAMTDPGLLSLFLRFLETCGVDRSVPTYRVSIHETADPDAAAEWWAGELGLPTHRFQRASLKKHNPSTLRRNTGEGYRGCLVINVPRSRELYWRIEGMIAELFRSAAEHTIVD
ncbi:helix-turn-helix domain-containing protein [Micromonospora sp. NPDC051296]|uniref:helix-turn-helix domain-containing protein n=1 Tax=Micromonospora sp. NPDC051296 TaxID=3155046 RepID=UPI0034126C52